MQKKDKPTIQSNSAINERSAKKVKLNASMVAQSFMESPTRQQQKTKEVEESRDVQPNIEQSTAQTRGEKNEVNNSIGTSSNLKTRIIKLLERRKIGIGKSLKEQGKNEGPTAQPLKEKKISGGKYSDAELKLKTPGVQQLKKRKIERRKSPEAELNLEKQAHQARKKISIEKYSGFQQSLQSPTVQPPKKKKQ